MPTRRRERPLGLDLHEDVAAFEAEMRVARQRAGEQPALGEDLEAVAHAEHVAAAGGVSGDRRHDVTDLGDGAAAEVVAVAEASRDRDEVDAGRERGLLVPDRGDLRARELERADHLGVGVQPRKEHHGSAHALRVAHVRGPSGV